MAHSRENGSELPSGYLDPSYRLALSLGPIAWPYRLALSFGDHLSSRHDAVPCDDHVLITKLDRPSCHRLMVFLVDLAYAFRDDTRHRLVESI